MRDAALTTPVRAGRALLAALGLSLLVIALLPPIPQDPSYHDFADRRAWLGVPNAGDVLGNLAFPLVGLWGLAVLARHPAAARSRAERAGWTVFFTAVLLTGFGSGWYHLAPDNGRLVWDRLPIAIACQGLLAALVAERVSERAAAWLLPVASLFAASSVWWWWHTERAGAGDLRPSARSQFGPGLSLLLVALLAPRREGGRADWIWGAFGFYLAAKLAEHFDRALFAAGGVVSGHTLKHLLAAGAAGWVAWALGRRVNPRGASAPARGNAGRAGAAPRPPRR